MSARTCAMDGSPTMSTSWPVLAASNSSVTTVISAVVCHSALGAVLPQVVDTAVQATASSFVVGAQAAPVPHGGAGYIG